MCVYLCTCIGIIIGMCTYIYIYIYVYVYVYAYAYPGILCTCTCTCTCICTSGSRPEIPAGRPTGPPWRRSCWPAAHWRGHATPCWRKVLLGLWCLYLHSVLLLLCLLCYYDLYSAWSYGSSVYVVCLFVLPSHYPLLTQGVARAGQIHIVGFPCGETLNPIPGEPYLWQRLTTRRCYVPSCQT